MGNKKLEEIFRKMVLLEERFSIIEIQLKGISQELEDYLKL